MINTRMKLLRYTVLGAGLLGMLFRFLLYATAIDQKGLLISSHWTTWLILILTGLILVLLLIATGNPPGPKAYEDCFPCSVSQGATSMFFGAVIVLRTILQFFKAGTYPTLITSILAIAAGIALASAGICRFTGKRPSFLCHSALSLYLALQIVSQYRHWSADPQLMNYGFYLVSLVCLMLTAYSLAGFDADMGNHRSIRFFSLAAAYLCFLAIPESGDGAFLIAGALWAFFCAPQSQARVRRQRPAMMLDEENEHENS